MTHPITSTATTTTRTLPISGYVSRYTPASSTTRTHMVSESDNISKPNVVTAVPISSYVSSRPGASTLTTTTSPAIVSLTDRTADRQRQPLDRLIEKPVERQAEKPVERILTDRVGPSRTVIREPITSTAATERRQATRIIEPARSTVT